MYYKPDNHKKIMSGKWAIFVIMLLIFLTNSIFANTEAGALFLLISPSPQANAMGQTYGNIAGKDPMTAQFNPASLGLWAQNNYFAISYYSPKTDWLSNYSKRIKYNSRSIAFGINLISRTELSISYGISFNETSLDLGYVDQWDYRSNNYKRHYNLDESHGVSMALALDYFVTLSFGYTPKKISSTRPHQFIAGMKADINAYDLGFIFKIPVVELTDKSRLLPIKSLLPFQPYFNPGLYYSLTNIGDRIVYNSSFDTTQINMLPRNVSLGINLETGVKYNIKKISVNLFTFNWSHETDDILVKTFTDKPDEYVSGFNDIKILDNLILGKANDKIISKKGWQYELLDFYSYRQGSYEDFEGRVILKTQGYKINFLQPWKLLLHFHYRTLFNGGSLKITF